VSRFQPSLQAATRIVPIGGYQPLPAASQLYYPRGSTFHAAASDTLWWLFVGPHGRWLFAAVNGASAVSQLRRSLQSQYWDKADSRLPSGRALGQLFDPNIPKIDRPMLLRMAYALRASMRAREGFPFATEAYANALEQDAVNNRVSSESAIMVLLMQYHMNGPQTIFPLSTGPGERFYIRPLTGSGWRPVFDTPVLPSASWEVRPMVAELDQLPLSGIAAIDSKRFERVSSSGTRTAPQVSPPPASTPSAPPTSAIVVTGSGADRPIRIIDAEQPPATTSATPGAFTQQAPPPTWGPITIVGGGGKPPEPTVGGGSTTPPAPTQTPTPPVPAPPAPTAPTGPDGARPPRFDGAASSLTGALSPTAMLIIVVAVVAALGGIAFLTMRERGKP
jgi:hypothetical protein